MRALLALAAPLLVSAAPSERPRLTFEGLGKIRIGMTIVELKAQGFASDAMYDGQSSEEYDGCHYMSNGRDYPGVSFMINDGYLVRIGIHQRSDSAPPESSGIYTPKPIPAWRSLSGVGIGMSESDASAIYGDWLKISGHPYLGSAGSYLRLDSSDGKYAMIFETAIKNMSRDGSKDGDQQKFITSFRSGLAGPVSYIEGCA